MSRTIRQRIGQETSEIVNRGWYELENGREIRLAQLVENCLSLTRHYAPIESDALVGHTVAKYFDTQFEVANETSLSAARRCVVEFCRTQTLCLNFASAKNPGGGFLGGSQAQEESLARSSALYASLVTQLDTYYATNRSCGTALYTDCMIVSPSVPVFRTDDGSLLAEPYLLAILTSPAVNAGAVLRNEPEKESLIRPVMASRLARILAIAAHHGYEHLVLGAWGCGVFRNDPNQVAELFGSALLDGGPFHGCFRTVSFAVYDTTPDERIIRPFLKVFAS
jgi:uncharacterized protein (TIGR02452 family)